MRDIYLPELISINIRNYTLYPNGLDFSYDFVNGFNLVIGGNGMGKTTFVSLIKYAIIGNYKKQYDYSRTYQANKIEKRLRNPESYFKNRIDNSVALEAEPLVTISFRIKEVVFTISRSLTELKIESLFIDGIEIEGEKITEERFEDIKYRNKRQNAANSVEHFLPYIYEEKVKQYSGLSFDDLIFFINYILFFGEDHKTILWDEDVQKELFNTFFNSPELNLKRQEAEREAKYFDSLARHKSEDIRAIRKVLDKIEAKNSSDNKDNPLTSIISLKEEIEKIDNSLLSIHEKRRINSDKVAILSSDINKLSLNIDEIEVKRNALRHKLSFAEYKNHHRLYNTFLTNIKANHICPLCNTKSESLYAKAIEDHNKCWSCGNELVNVAQIDAQTQTALSNIEKEYEVATTKLKNKQLELKSIENTSATLDSQFKLLENDKRKNLARLRELEYENSQESNPGELSAFYEEIEKLSKEKDELSERSEEKKIEANEISLLIENTILKNVQNFSSLFSHYANKFLGVECLLTYDKLGNDLFKKFYPVIAGTIRISEYELSESQRFFIDHSFRMSILTHFYKTPSFYIVETPDSSLDLSYEKNAADVFTSFLEYPFALILTSNLNNSTFIDYILQKKNDVDVGIVPLFEIAKKSAIQENNPVLKQLYEKIKSLNNG